jgi:hypothetical protein
MRQLCRRFVHPVEIDLISQLGSQSQNNGSGATCCSNLIITKIDYQNTVIVSYLVS